MPTFDFNTGANVLGSPGSNISIDFTDKSVPFTLSTSGNGGYNDLTYNGVGGDISITDSSVNGVFTLDVDTSQVNGNFGASGGNISLQIGGSVSGAWNVTFVNENTTLPDQQFASVSAGQLLSFSTSSTFSEIKFTPTGTNNFIQIDSLTATIVCYLQGTGIATPTGRIAVEALQPGDKILTAAGGTTTVRWVGIQPVDVRTATPAKVNPICFVAGSIAPNVPSRDLFVSPDHAMEIDGILYNATALANGRSIYQMAQMPLDGFTYYHIDTGTHEVILAEDAASETYLDAVGRETFVNGAEMANAAIIPEMTLPRIVARRMVPHDVVQDLSDRADALGLRPRANAA